MYPTQANAGDYAITSWNWLRSSGYAGTWSKIFLFYCTLGCYYIHWKWKLLSHVWPLPTPWTTPWNSPGHNGVGTLFLLQDIFPIQGSNPGLLDCRRILYHLSHKGIPNGPNECIELITPGCSIKSWSHLLSVSTPAQWYITPIKCTNAPIKLEWLHNLVFSLCLYFTPNQLRRES